jgi:pilus assembly protein CpaB
MGRRALVLVIALVLAGVAAFSIFQYLSGIEEDVLAGQEEVIVYRAINPIAEGTEGNFILQGAGTLYQESTEQLEDLPQGAIQNQDQLQSILGGRVAAGPISGNQILTANQWVQLTVEITPLAELIPEGKQAITVSPGAVQGVNGFVRPGDRVNIIITVEIEFRLTALAQESPDFGIPVEDTTADGETPEDQLTVTYTRYVLQGIPVMAVGQAIRPEPDADLTGEISATPEVDQGTVQEGEAPALSTVFTLEVTPEEAEKLVFAQSSGSLYYTLVPEDFVEVDTRGVTIEQLFEGDLVEDIFGNN